MKLLTLATLSAVSLLILSGCSGITPKPISKAKIDTSLPVVTLTKNGLLEDMNSIAFEWKSIKDTRVKGIYVYKSTLTKSKKAISENDFYKTINNRFATHYLDTDITPDTRYSYFFKTFSKNGESRRSKIIFVHSLPVLNSVSWIHSVTNMPRSAKIIWRPDSNQIVKAYIIERKTLSDDTWSQIATVNGRLNAEYIDTDLKDGYVYLYRVRVLTYDNITSKPSATVKIVTKQLPKEVTNITASKDLPRKIEIRWDKSNIKDFKRYYLYRAKNVNGSYKLIAKLYNNLFVDKINKDAKQFFYRVSVVDKDGLESVHNKYSIQGMTLIKPNAPMITEAKFLNNKITIAWKKTDLRTKSYIVRKIYKKNWFNKVSKDYRGIVRENFVDKDIVAGRSYTYEVFAVDKYSIVSKASSEVNVIVPESNKILKATPIESKEELATPSSSTHTKSDDVIVPVPDLSVNEN